MIERCVPGVKKDGAKKLYPTSEKVYIRKDFKLNDSGEYNRLMLMKNLICAYDADAQSDPETAVLVGYQPDVYFKGNNLYLLDYPDRGKTNITKLSTADKKITYKAFGEAEGVPIDNLSAGEYNKTFRLATYTVTQAKNGKLTGCENHISVFDDELKLVSHTSVLKDKYYPSVNFIGDAAYFNVYNAENDYRLYSVSLKNADKGGAAELTGAPLKLDVSYSKMHGAGEHIFAAGVNRDLGVNVALFSKKPDGSLKLIKSERVRDSREWKMLSAATEEITALCRLPGSDSLLIPIVYDDADGFSESAGAVEYSVKDGALKQKGRYYTGRYSAVLKISATNERVYMLDDYGVTAFDAKSRKKLYFESLR